MDSKKFKIFISYYDELKKDVYNGNFTKIKNLISDLEKSILENNFTVEETKCVIYSILGVVSTAVCVKSIPTKVIKSAPDLAKIEEISEIHAVVSLLSGTVSDTAYNVSKSVSERFATIEAIKKFINTYYSEYEFCVQNIADYFSLTVPAICQYFKSKTGETISDYVWSLRLSTATKLLIDSDIPIKEIVLRVGYIDSSSFSRKFRETLGVSPAEYRKRAYLM